MNPTPDSANAIVVASASSRRGLVDERWTEIAVIWTPGKRKPWTVEILGKSNVEGDDEKRYVKAGGRLEAVLDRIDDSLMGVAVKADARDWLRDNVALVFGKKGDPDAIFHEEARRRLYESFGAGAIAANAAIETDPVANAIVQCALRVIAQALEEGCAA